ncbi:MAG: SpoIVB peptidase [Clostridia bacterium]|nr:SpoIVB peptidase [Clostridia bacterium]
MKTAVKRTAIILACVCAIVFGVCTELQSVLPDEITAYKDEIISFRNFTTITFKNQSKNETDSTPVQSGSLALFDIIPVKNITVHRSDKKTVVPCGTLFGIKFYARGAAVIECCDISTGEKTVNPGKECGLAAGDTILKIDGCEIKNCADVERLTRLSGGDTMTLSCLREGKEFTADIHPICCSGEYRLGLWIKDSAAGLGTMTFYEPDSGAFASLGHGMCDEKTGELLNIDRADITEVTVTGITKGTPGKPGIINGCFSDAPALGTASFNNECGLYGTLRYIPPHSQAIEIASIQEVKRGSAKILCALDSGEPRLYDIEITRVDYDKNNKTKNLQITVCDPRLTSLTGGIVQGMSGCPILQNGKLAGAVTHVLITNSAKGYGIFAQNMFEEMEKAQN